MTFIHQVLQSRLGVTARVQERCLRHSIERALLYLGGDARNLYFGKCGIGVLARPEGCHLQSVPCGSNPLVLASWMSVQVSSLDRETGRFLAVLMTGGRFALKFCSLWWAGNDIARWND
ncbi:MAG: hypothetical protein CMM07_08205 [Rhodopirellula sp.]|nr:hypothetical protein [Rhodopirellula sp.]